jgi:hypothetical protein
MSDRDILISVATRQESLSADFLKFTNIQSGTNVKLDDRVRELELNGSKVSKDLATTVYLIDRRLCDVETSCSEIGTELVAKKTWIDSIYTKTGIIVGIIISGVALMFDIYLRIRGDP